MSQEDMIKEEEAKETAITVSKAVMAEVIRLQAEIKDLTEQATKTKAQPTAAKKEEEPKEFVFVASNKKKTADEQITESEKKVSSSSNEGPDEDGVFVF